MPYPNMETKESPCYLERLVNNVLNRLEEMGVGGFETSKKRLSDSLEVLRVALSDSNFAMASATVEMMICSLQIAQTSYEVSVLITPRHLNGVLTQADAEMRRMQKC